MAFPALGQKYLVTFVGRMFGQTILNTFWYRLAVLGPETSINTLMDNINTQLMLGARLQDKFIACVPEEYAHVENWIQCIAPTRYAKKRYTVAEIGGGNPSNQANTDGVITRRGELANRKNVSSLYVPISQIADDVHDGLLVPAGVKVQLAALALEMLQPITTAGTPGAKLYPCIFQPKNNVAGTAYDITETFVQDTARVMTRRTVGRGI